MGVPSWWFDRLARDLVEIVRANIPDTTSVGIVNVVSANLCCTVNRLLAAPDDAARIRMCSFPAHPPTCEAATCPLRGEGGAA